jgi:hypothetical protein
VSLLGDYIPEHEGVEYPYRIVDVQRMVPFMSYAWVSINAVRLGGRKFPTIPGGSKLVWCFPSTVDEKLYELTGGRRRQRRTR